MRSGTSASPAKDDRYIYLPGKARRPRPRRCTAPSTRSESDDQRLRSAGCPRWKARASNASSASRGGEPGCRGIAASFQDRAHPDSACASGVLHARHPWPSDRKGPAFAMSTLGPGALNFTIGDRQRASRCDADADDHRPEGHRGARRAPDRRHRGRDAPSDQDDAADRLRRLNSDHRARRVPLAVRRTARPGPSSNFPRISPTGEETSLFCPLPSDRTDRSRGCRACHHGGCNDPKASEVSAAS